MIIYINTDSIQSADLLKSLIAERLKLFFNLTVRANFESNLLSDLSILKYLRKGWLESFITFPHFFVKAALQSLSRSVTLQLSFFADLITFFTFFQSRDSLLPYQHAMQKHMTDSTVDW